MDLGRPLIQGNSVEPQSTTVPTMLTNITTTTSRSTTTATSTPTTLTVSTPADTKAIEADKTEAQGRSSMISFFKIFYFIPFHWIFYLYLYLLMKIALFSTGG